MSISYGAIPMYFGTSKNFVLLNKIQNNSNKWEFCYDQPIKSESPRDVAMRSFIQTYKINLNYFEVLNSPTFKLKTQNDSLIEFFIVVLKKGHFSYIKDNEDIMRVKLNKLESYIDQSDYVDLVDKLKETFVDK